MEALFSYLGLSDINQGTMVCVCVSVWGWGWLLRFIPFQVLFCFLLPFLLVIKASLSGVALAPLRGTHFVFFSMACHVLACAPIVFAYFDIKGES